MWASVLHIDPTVFFAILTSKGMVISLSDVASTHISHLILKIMIG